MSAETPRTTPETTAPSVETERQSVAESARENMTDLNDRIHILRLHQEYTRLKNSGEQNHEMTREEIQSLHGIYMDLMNHARHVSQQENPNATITREALWEAGFNDALLANLNIVDIKEDLMRYAATAAAIEELYLPEATRMSEEQQLNYIQENYGTELSAEDRAILIAQRNVASGIPNNMTFGMITPGIITAGEFFTDHHGSLTRKMLAGAGIGYAALTLAMNVGLPFFKMGGSFVKNMAKLKPRVAVTELKDDMKEMAVNFPQAFVWTTIPAAIAGAAMLGPQGALEATQNIGRTVGGGIREAGVNVYEFVAGTPRSQIVNVYKDKFKNETWWQNGEAFLNATARMERSESVGENFAFLDNGNSTRNVERIIQSLHGVPEATFQKENDTLGTSQRIEAHRECVRRLNAIKEYRNSVQAMFANLGTPEQTVKYGELANLVVKAQNDRLAGPDFFERFGDWFMENYQESELQGGLARTGGAIDASWNAFWQNFVIRRTTNFGSAHGVEPERPQQSQALQTEQEEFTNRLLALYPLIRRIQNPVN